MYLKENKYNPKKKWSYINKLLGRSANACEYDITINNVQVTDLNDVGNHFKNFYAKIPHNLANLFPAMISDIPTPINPNSFFFKLIEATEVIERVFTLNNCISWS